ncbi:MAG TPA: AraC family transcriptional regulator ligand-binding domain-containing protein [Polyangiales bacterium]
MRDRTGHHPRVFAEYVAHLVDVCTRFGVRPEQLLKGTGLRTSDLEQLDKLLPRALFYELIQRALTLTREPGLGFHYGMSLKQSAHGPLGLLAMTSGTLGDALNATVRYASLRLPDVSLSTYVEEHERVLEIEHHVAPEMRVFVAESFLLSLLQIGRALVGHQLPVRCDFAFPEPAHFKRFAHLMPEVRFGRQQDALRVPLSALDEAVVTSDSVMARRIERELSRELSVLDERASYLTRVRRQLRPHDIPSLEVLAERLGTSTRTLKRHLAAHGTSYRQLVEELRRERATTLLRDTDQTMTQIAEQLGYTDRASFHRAYRRWFATSPGRGR